MNEHDYDDEDEEFDEEDDLEDDEDEEEQDEDEEDEDDDDDDYEDEEVEDFDDSEEGHAKWLRFIRRLEGRAMARVESELVDVRELYETLDDEQRAKLSQWINEVVAVHRKMPDILPCDAKLRVGLTNVRKNEVVLCVPTLTLKNALDAWKRGNEYSPTTISEWSDVHPRGWPKE